MKINMDFDICWNDTLSMRVVLKTFEDRAEGFLFVLREETPEVLGKEVQMAVKGCVSGPIALAE